MRSCRINYSAGKTMLVSNSITLPMILGLTIFSPVEVVSAQSEKGKITGTIVIEDGSPAVVEGTLQIESRSDSSGYSGNGGSFKDKFSVDVPPGKVWLKYFPQGYVPAWVGPLDLKAGATIKEVELVLKQGFTQKFRITDIEGTPITDMKISAMAARSRKPSRSIRTASRA